jgi:hypothetical protein
MPAPHPGGVCGAAASWTCARESHFVEALCAQCVRRQQAQLIGGPGPKASTDVYDALVERETLRRDGQVHQTKSNEIKPNETK